MCVILLFAATSGYSAYKFNLRPPANRRSRGDPVGDFRPHATSSPELDSGD